MFFTAVLINLSLVCPEVSALSCFFIYRYQSLFLLNCHYFLLSPINFYQIASGSDCGNIFIWETKSGKLINIFKGDSVGAVNCLR